MRRRLATSLLAMGIVLATALPASAHGGTHGDPVPADGDERVSAPVPAEQPGAHDTRIPASGSSTHAIDPSPSVVGVDPLAVVLLLITTVSLTVAAVTHRRIDGTPP